MKVSPVNNPPPQKDRDQRGSESRASVVWHESVCTAETRAKRKSQHPVCIWLTGLSASGKSTLGNALEMRLLEQGCHTYPLDGDNVRHGLNKNLAMSDNDRVENIRRIGEVARLMTDAGLFVIAAFISLFRDDREQVRALFSEHQFIEVFVYTPQGLCEERDPKGMYKKARSGEIKNSTGIGSVYESSENPEIHLRTAGRSVEQCVSELHGFLQPLIQPQT